MGCCARSCTQYTGTSGGALVAAGMCCGVEPRHAMEEVKDLARVCRERGTFMKLTGPVREMLERILPEDGATRCNGKLTVAVTKAWPNPKITPEHISHFTSKRDLIEALIAASHIPFYLSPSPWTIFRGEHYVDGGLVHPVPIVTSPHINITPFPPRFVRRSDIDISPYLMRGPSAAAHSLVQSLSGQEEPDKRASVPSQAQGAPRDDEVRIQNNERSRIPLPALLQWVLLPGNDKQLESMYWLGEEAALEWFGQQKKSKA